MIFKKKLSIFVWQLTIASILLGLNLKAIAADKVDFNFDFYGVQTNLMPHRGYQNDLSTTMYLKYMDYKLMPFLRFIDTHYYYLPSEQPSDSDYTSDRRLASGMGLDYKVNDYLKFRYIVESIDNKLSATNYSQESYGLIYNQYLNLNYIEFNNYLESFLIPRVDSKQLDTFLKVQAFKTFYISQQAEYSNVFYPLVQIKAKSNDNANFGVSGQNASVGLGYRFYGANEKKDSLAFVFEGHSLFYQSEKLYGDWFQIMAALQVWID